MGLEVVPTFGKETNERRAGDVKEDAKQRWHKLHFREI